MVQANVKSNCQVCGVPFERYVAPSALRKGRAKNLYCSRACKGKALSGERHPMWKGGRIQEADGYVMIHVPEHPHANNKGYVFEHRLVLEKVLGRYLLPSEVVHHKDENRSNNTPSNLQLYSGNGAHLAGHYGVTISVVRKIRTLRKAGMSQPRIAAQCGVAQATVSRIVNGKRWSQV